MKIKIIISFTLIYLVSSCSSYKYTYKYVPIEPEDNIKIMDKMYISVLDSSQLYVMFTKKFLDSKLKFYENNQVKFDSIISTGSSGYLGLAKVFKIEKKSTITIYLDNVKKPIRIKRTQIDGYKSIYISKKDNSIDIEFNNKRKYTELNSK